MAELDQRFPGLAALQRALQAKGIAVNLYNNRFALLTDDEQAGANEGETGSAAPAASAPQPPIAEVGEVVSTALLEAAANTADEVGDLKAKFEAFGPALLAVAAEVSATKAGLADVKEAIAGILAQLIAVANGTVTTDQLAATKESLLRDISSTLVEHLARLNGTVVAQVQRLLLGTEQATCEQVNKLGNSTLITNTVAKQFAQAGQVGMQEPLDTGLNISTSVMPTAHTTQTLCEQVANLERVLRRVLAAKAQPQVPSADVVNLSESPVKAPATGPAAPAALATTTDTAVPMAPAPATGTAAPVTVVPTTGTAPPMAPAPAAGAAATIPTAAAPTAPITRDDLVDVVRAVLAGRVSDCEGYGSEECVDGPGEGQMHKHTHRMPMPSKFHGNPGEKVENSITAFENYFLGSRLPQELWHIHAMSLLEGKARDAWMPVYREKMAHNQPTSWSDLVEVLTANFGMHDASSRARMQLHRARQTTTVPQFALYMRGLRTQAGDPPIPDRDMILTFKAGLKPHLQAHCASNPATCREWESFSDLVEFATRLEASLLNQRDRGPNPPHGPHPDARKQTPNPIPKGDRDRRRRDNDHRRGRPGDTPKSKLYGAAARAQADKKGGGRGSRGNSADGRGGKRHQGAGPSNNQQQRDTHLPATIKCGACGRLGHGREDPACPHRK